MKKLFTAALFLFALAYIISCEQDNATDINLDTPLEEVLNQTIDMRFARGNQSLFA
jgi:hypothetical protein